jgi:hypothetical protein
MKFFYFEPEVAGGIGPKSDMDNSVWPPRIRKLQYVFDGWLGDAILESFPCFIVTDVAAKALLREGLTGFELDDVEVSVSELFRELYPGQELPVFRWLKITGEPGVDDFGVGADHRLVVSERVTRTLQAFGIKKAITKPTELYEN